MLAREDIWFSGSRLECQAHLSEGDDPPAPARGPLSDLGRLSARGQAPVDLCQGLCRYRLSRQAVPRTIGRRSGLAHPRPPGARLPASGPPKTAEGGSATAVQRRVDASRGSADAPIVLPHTSMRPPTSPSRDAIPEKTR